MGLRRRASVSERAAALPRRVSDHAGLGDPRGARALQALRRPHLPGRRRDRRASAPRSARPSAARSASSTSSGPGVVLKIGDDRARGRARAAARHPRHPARRPVDRDADQAGAGRPAARAVRPQRRVAGAGGRGRDAGRLLRRRDRGGAHRAQVPDAGVPALRRLPRQRLRAVADPGRVERCPTSPVAFATAEPRRPVPPVPARRRDARAAVGDSGHAGPRAPDRRAREGGRHRQRLLRPRQPRPDGPDPRAQGRGHRRATFPSSRSTATRTRDVLVVGWGGTYGPIAAGGRGDPRGRRQGRARALRAPQPAPARTSSEVLRGSTGCSCRR